MASKWKGIDISDRFINYNQLVIMLELMKDQAKLTKWLNQNSKAISENILRNNPLLRDIENGT